MTKGAAQNIQNGQQAVNQKWVPSDYEIRQSALHQACHDFRGEAPAAQVVERARDYYNFLSGDNVGRGYASNVRESQVAGAVAL